MRKVENPLGERGKEVVKKVLDNVYEGNSFDDEMENLRIIQNKAETGLFSDDPNHQYSSLVSMSHMADFSWSEPESISPDVMERLMELAFGTHGSQRVHDESLSVIELLCSRIPWVIVPFLDLDLHNEIMKCLTDEHTTSSHARLSYILNAILRKDDDTFKCIMDLEYDSFLIQRLKMPDVDISDKLWQMAGLQAIMCCLQFEYEKRIPEIVELVLEHRSLSKEISALCFSIMARIVAEHATPELLEESLIAEALSELNPEKFHRDQVSYIIDYLTNVMYLSDEETMKILGFSDFFDHLSGVFMKGDKVIQTKILDMLCNAVVSHPDAAVAVAKCEICGHFKQILTDGEFMKKKAVMRLLTRIIAKMEIEDSLEFVQGLELVPSIIDLLYCDDDDVIMTVITGLGFLGSRGIRAVDMDALSFLFDELDEYVIEQLHELTDSDNERVADAAGNLIDFIMSASP